MMLAFLLGSDPAALLPVCSCRQKPVPNQTVVLGKGTVAFLRLCAQHDGGVVLYPAGCTRIYQELPITGEILYRYVKDQVFRLKNFGRERMDRCVRKSGILAVYQAKSTKCADRTAGFHRNWIPAAKFPFPGKKGWPNYCGPSPGKAYLVKPFFGLLGFKATW